MAAAAVDSKVGLYENSTYSTSQNSLSPSTAHSHTTLNNQNGHTLSYQQATPGIYIVAVDGADDEESDVVFSDPSAGKKPLFALSRRSIEASLEGQGSSDDLHLINCQNEQPICRIRSDRDLKTFDLTDMTSGSSTTLKPTKKLGTHKLQLEAPTNVSGSSSSSPTWVWKGSVFKSMELYAKDAQGNKRSLAVYIRTSTRSHTLRLYTDAMFVSTSSDSRSNQDVVSLCPDLPVVLATLWPFIAMYRKILVSEFTSERKVLQRSAGAQPSRWDAAILGDPLKGASMAEVDRDGQSGPQGLISRPPHVNGNGNGTSIDANGDNDDTQTLHGNQSAESSGDVNGNEAGEGASTPRFQGAATSRNASPSPSRWNLKSVFRRGSGQ